MSVSVLLHFQLLPTKNWMSLRQKVVGTLSVPPFNYSPGSRSKNNATQARLSKARLQYMLPLAAVARVGGLLRFEKNLF